jgi:DNA-binding NarL/FixJ family response regulator
MTDCFLPLPVVGHKVMSSLHTNKDDREPHDTLKAHSGAKHCNPRGGAVPFSDFSNGRPGPVGGNTPVSTSPLPAEKTVCVVGPRRLQNQLMARFLEEQIGVTCLQLQKPSAPNLQAGRANGCVSLYLWDCSGTDLTSGIEDLNSVRKGTPLDGLLGMFNVGSLNPHDAAALDQGVRGIFFEEDSMEQIARGVSGMLDGELWLPRKMMAAYIVMKALTASPPMGPGEDLTPREREILLLIQEGRSNREISESLNIRPKTVKNHIHNLFRKINVSSRLQAALWANGDLRK